MLLLRVPTQWHENAKKNPWFLAQSIHLRQPSYWVIMTIRDGDHIVTWQWSQSGAQNGMVYY